MDLVGIRVHEKDAAALMRDVCGWWMALHLSWTVSAHAEMSTSHQYCYKTCLQ